ncbi:succinylglutamate desuccinylase/aspartoacylase family protein [Glaciecola petra]|uniref:Succinylglutamate desuccinylase/aspartoacylase family protein n=1 Tax=Glaciecola petra TaxID=3075602 RepID=A0ABU2ZRC1_9ALTE|nr:succinylglutamate desuccinylase/aspartoacylase family protein [Aestuariibacter sp. P117]MDT0595188.1 succinylglutamate desuccinylase/aspartoacylase family protein [Aestuariibacter sp. P117]
MSILKTVFLLITFVLVGVWCSCVHAKDTIYSGDKIQGTQTVYHLNPESLAPGLHRFYLQAGWRNSGMPIYVPVIIIKGTANGPRLTLTAAVHGDELNGIATIHELIKEIDYQALSGIVVAVPGLNQPALNTNTRHYVTSNGSGNKTNLNRIAPGDISKGGAQAYMARIWQGLMMEDSDLAVDLHTQTTGTAYTYYAFADVRNKKAEKIAMLMGPDVIKEDEGVNGTLETTFMQKGIPAITLELGEPRRFQADMIYRSVKGIKNVMRAWKMLDGEYENLSSKTYVGKNISNISADIGGIAFLKVGLLDKVEKGQILATLNDPLGREIANYKAPSNGIVVAIATYPLREEGSLLVRLLTEIRP